jgi:23S rRNA (pseudouridine1915-N3)-methyltransferase
MRLLIAAIGKLKHGPERALFEVYAERASAAGRAVSLGPVDLVEISESRLPTAKARKEAEADTLLAKLQQVEAIICLDPAGKTISSEAFARQLAKWRDAGRQSVGLAVGGPDGLIRAVAEKAALNLSLGPMTLPHGLARVVLAEQLYRAATILSGHPYHRG